MFTAFVLGIFEVLTCHEIENFKKYIAKYNESQTENRVIIEE